jgi:hypothetical protein
MQSAEDTATHWEELRAEQASNPTPGSKQDLYFSHWYCGQKVGDCWHTAQPGAPWDESGRYWSTKYVDGDQYPPDWPEDVVAPEYSGCLGLRQFRKYRKAETEHERYMDGAKIAICTPMRLVDVKKWNKALGLYHPSDFPEEEDDYPCKCNGKLTFPNALKHRQKHPRILRACDDEYKPCPLRFFTPCGRSDFKDRRESTHLANPLAESKLELPSIEPDYVKRYWGTSVLLCKECVHRSETEFNENWRATADSERTLRQKKLEGRKADREPRWREREAEEALKKQGKKERLALRQKEWKQKKKEQKEAEKALEFEQRMVKCIAVLWEGVLYGWEEKSLELFCGPPGKGKRTSIGEWDPNDEEPILHDIWEPDHYAQKPSDKNLMFESADAVVRLDHIVAKKYEWGVTWRGEAENLEPEPEVFPCDQSEEEELVEAMEDMEVTDDAPRVGRAFRYAKTTRETGKEEHIGAIAVITKLGQKKHSAKFKGGVTKPSPDGKKRRSSFTIGAGVKLEYVDGEMPGVDEIHE